jgi:hypothetical protein
MKIFFLLTFISLSAFAGEIIKVSDGSVAECKTSVDFNRYNGTVIYRPLNMDFSEGKAQVNVEFLKCVENNGNYGFVRDGDVFETVVTYQPGPFECDVRVVRIKRELFSVLALGSDETRHIANGELKSLRSGIFSATLPLERSSLEVNRNGNRYFDMVIAYKVKIIDVSTNKVIDSKIDYLGSYRMIIK